MSAPHVVYLSVDPRDEDDPQPVDWARLWKRHAARLRAKARLLEVGANALMTENDAHCAAYLRYARERNDALAALRTFIDAAVAHGAAGPLADAVAAASAELTRLDPTQPPAEGT